MPHLFVNRPRYFSRSTTTVSLEELVTAFRWESINAVSYILGGILLIVGSVLFLPQFAEYEHIGSWIFVVASILYLNVALHDIVEVIRRGRATSWDIVDGIAASTYAIGAMLFILGSVFFLPAVGLNKGGGWCFIIGSLLFVVGAFANSIQIYESPSWMTNFYANLVAVQFVAGSAMYLSASVPYTFDLDTDRDNDLIFRFAAILYIFGSILFTTAGFFNYYRALLMIKLEKEKGAAQKAAAQDGQKMETVTTAENDAVSTKQQMDQHQSPESH